MFVGTRELWHGDKRNTIETKHRNTIATYHWNTITNKSRLPFHSLCVLYRLSHRVPCNLLWFPALQQRCHWRTVPVIRRGWRIHRRCVSISSRSIQRLRMHFYHQTVPCIPSLSEEGTCISNRLRSLLAKRTEPRPCRSISQVLPGFRLLWEQVYRWSLAFNEKDTK